jgi:hypothetical protein
MQGAQLETNLGSKELGRLIAFFGVEKEFRSLSKSPLASSKLNPSVPIMLLASLIN